jgi:single-strand DNA-binding protein
VNGIHAAFTGRIGKDAEVRTTRDGKPWAAFPVAVDTNVDSEAGTSWVRCALFGDTVDTLAPRLTKGTQVYCEGRMTLRSWTDADGKARAGLSLAASLVQPMGQIGRRPRVRDEREAV